MWTGSSRDERRSYGSRRHASSASPISRRWGRRPRAPFYLFGQNGDLKIDIGIADEEDGALWVKVHKRFFTIDDEEPPAGYRLRLPPDTFDRPPVELEGIPVWTASPLALYQLRVGIARQGSFGPLSERHLEMSRA
jgi:hypothetical protein